MPRIMKSFAAAACTATIVFAVLYTKLYHKTFLSLAITFGTISYHLIMRLLVGLIFDLTMHNKADYTQGWYQVGRTEQKLYQRLKVKKWKNIMPTYDSDVFDPSRRSWDEIAQAMCQAELVHETIILLSFLPIVASVWFSDIAVFIVTSVIAALIDLLFVIMQRYNRPRIIRSIKR